MIFQEFSVVPTLTVAQNVFLGRERRGPPSGFSTTGHRWSARPRALFERDGRDGRPEPAPRVDDCAHRPYWQLTEIAKARGRRTRGS